VPWREPPAEFRQRDLGIADLEVASKYQLQDIGQAGIQLLASLPAAQQNDDSEVLSRLGALMVDQNLMHGALALLRRASEREPTSGASALHFAIALRRFGNFDQAVVELNRAIELDPSLERAYLELSALHQQKGQTREAGETLDRFLKWNSQSITARLAKEALKMSGN
jgi:tetratricopeptide (TPR) repeat protein